MLLKSQSASSLAELAIIDASKNATKHLTSRDRGHHHRRSLSADSKELLQRLDSDLRVTGYSIKRNLSIITEQEEQEPCRERKPTTRADYYQYTQRQNEDIQRLSLENWNLNRQCHDFNKRVQEKRNQTTWLVRNGPVAISILQNAVCDLEDEKSKLMKECKDLEAQISKAVNAAEAIVT